MEKQQLYTFGEFTLSLEEKCLRRGDVNISLTPKMYELLVVLVENHDRVVEKDVLMTAVWPDSFVEEGNITFNIRQLRKALGDDAQDPLYIETIPRRGYRFMAKVATGDENAALAIEPKETVSGKLNEGRKWFGDWRVPSAAGILLLVAAAATVAWFTRGSVSVSAPILSTPFSAEKLSTDGKVYHAVISPDGKTLVYTHRDGAEQSLWLRHLETANNVPIIPASESFYGGLAFSPDGSIIYFTKGFRPRRNEQLDIYRLPVYGGVAQKIAPQTQGWISVSPDGAKISYVRCSYEDNDYCSLFIANAADGRDERKIVTSPRPFRIADNKISPDGKKVAFAVGQSRTAANEFSFREVDIQTGETRDITSKRFFNINYIAWLPDQSGWLLTAKNLPEKGYRIWHVPASGGEPARLSADSETYSRLSLDAKGSLLVTTRIDEDFSLHIYQTNNVAAAPKILGNASSSSFGANGRIVYASQMTGDVEIWSSNVDGSDRRQLTNDPADDIAPIVSPDDRYIYFDSNRTGEIHVWRMEMDGSNPTQITTLEGGFPLVQSPDGKWLYYRSGLQNSLRRVSLQDGREELVLNNLSEYSSLSPDTLKIAVPTEKDGVDVFTIRSIATGNTEATYTSPDPAAHPLFVLWSPDGKNLAYVLEDDAHENRSLWFQDLNNGKPRRIADLGPGEVFELAGLTLSRDSSSFAAVQGRWSHNALLVKGLKPQQ